MTGIDEARNLFGRLGLPFPTFPAEFESGLRLQDAEGPTFFSTRDIIIWPYMLDEYVSEFDEGRAPEYVLLSFTGHGIGSNAMQYYLVWHGLGLFFHIGYGNAYDDPDEVAAEISHCFSLADEIVKAAETSSRLATEGGLTVVGSDFYGSYWLPHGELRNCLDTDGHLDPTGYRRLIGQRRQLAADAPGQSAQPARSLAGVLDWLTSSS